jgi:hypothetical protein
MDLYSTSKNCVGHYIPIALLVDSIWKIDNDYKETKSYVLSSFFKPILNVFITVANTTILKMVTCGIHVTKPVIFEDPLE